MKINLFLILFFIVSLFSCTYVDKTIELTDCKITIIGDTVGLQYHIYDVLINDQFENLSSEKLNYIKENINNLNISVRLYYNGIESVNALVYYIDGVVIAKNVNVLSDTLFIYLAKKFKNNSEQKIDKAKVIHRQPSSSQEQTINERKKL